MQRALYCDLDDEDIDINHTNIKTLPFIDSIRYQISIAPYLNELLFTTETNSNDTIYSLTINCYLSPLGKTRALINSKRQQYLKILSGES